MCFGASHDEIVNFESLVLLDLEKQEEQPYLYLTYDLTSSQIFVSS
jgi:hypothetical protein